MARNVYLNKREGCGKEFGAILLILLAVLLGVWVVYALFFMSEEVPDEPQQADTALTSAGSGEARCLVNALPEFNLPEFAGSPYTCSTADAMTIWSVVRNSPHVTENKLYATILGNTGFVYNAHDDSVNAFATSVERLQVKRPVVCLLGGATRFAKLIATALAYDQCEVSTGAVGHLLSQMTSTDWFKISEARASELNKLIASCALNGNASELTAKRKKADVLCNEIVQGMLLTILAHEAGHLAYGHVYTQGETRSNLEISRNQERDADSFCASVMSSSPYGKYMFEGGIFWWWVMARQEMNETTDSTRSHPLSRERFKNMVRANESLARKLGITEAESETLWQ